MKNRFLAITVAIMSIFSLMSCSTEYQMIAQGESFDALTKITDDKKVCFYPSGGDEGRNLAFSAKDDDGSVNIYFKEMLWLML